MALQCPECSSISHARSSFYEAPSIKRPYYLLSVQKPRVFIHIHGTGERGHIIARPNKVEVKMNPLPFNLRNQPKRWENMAQRPGYPTASKFLSDDSKQS
ncbi:MAG: hypothetical protein K0S17_1510 [Enterobacter mori]|nr:hypothetical protein [Enterobacter mori]